MSSSWTGGRGSHEPRRAEARRAESRQHWQRRRPQSAVLWVEQLEPRCLLHAGPHPDVPDLGIFPAIEAAADEHNYVEAAAAATGGGISAAALPGLPQLSSLPGVVAATLFLDFDGHYEPVWGSYTGVTTPVYDLDGDRTRFSATEAAAITQIWQRVAEDYAPFRVNVTTVEPASFANRAGLRVSIGGNGSWIGPYGGVGYVNAFTNSIANVAYVFSENLAGGVPQFVAEAASHEAGHSFGLMHQSLYNAAGQRVAEYNPGTADLAPIMGSSFTASRTIWHNGTTTSARTFQDDMAVIAGELNGFRYRPDDHGNTYLLATPLTRSGTRLSGSGIIANHTDADYFAFATAGGTVSFTVNVAPLGPNLDALLELYNANGQRIASANPTNAFGATLSATLAAGNYRLAVKATGGYGSAGQYTIVGSASDTSNPPPPPALTINDVSITEGNVGYREVTFTVRLSRAALSTVTVNYATANGSALAPSDYTFKSGTLTFAAGVTTQTISVRVIGDRTREAIESFFINLGQANGAVISDGRGQGTILNDDNSTSAGGLSFGASFALAFFDEADPGASVGGALFAGADFTSPSAYSLAPVAGRSAVFEQAASNPGRQAATIVRRVVLSPIATAGLAGLDSYFASLAAHARQSAEGHSVSASDDADAIAGRFRLNDPVRNALLARGEAE